MEIPEYLKRDPRLYAGFLQLFLRGTAQVLEDAPDGVFLKDTRGGLHMLAADAAQKAFGFKKRTPVYQGVYEKADPPHVVSPGLRIRPATEEDIPFVRENYRLNDDYELRIIVRDGELFIGENEKGERVGFLGRHLEGSMGLLVILPEFRHHGYAGAMESFLIDKTLREGLIAYGHIIVGNEASMSLQRELGFTIPDDVLYWVH